MAQQLCDHRNEFHSSLKFKLSPQDIARWKRAWVAVQVLLKSYGVMTWMGMRMTPYKPSFLQCKNRPQMEGLLGLPISLCFSLAAFVYGGLHVLAWFAHFGTFTQQVLWRISACVVMGELPIILALIGFRDLVWKVQDGFIRFGHRRRTPGLKYLEAVTWSLLRLSCLAYVLARAYLVFECFINLFYLPNGVYDVPTWSTYFPHVS